MRPILSLTLFLLALAASHGDEKVRAPVPKIPPPPTIDGKYTLLFTSNDSAPAGKGGGPAGRVARAEAVITGNEITIEGRTATAAPVMMEYAFDPTKSPMTIDVDTVSVRGKKTKALGVVEITGNRVTIALAKDGGDRPKTADEGDNVTVYYLLKAPPPPRVEYRIVAMTVGKEEEAEKELNKLSALGYELVNTTNPAAANDKAAATTVHFILKRSMKQP